MALASIGAALEGFGRGRMMREDRKRRDEDYALRRDELATRRAEAEALRSYGGGGRSISDDGASAGTGAAASFAGDQQAFIDALMPAAVEASKRTGIDPRIIVAQAAQETGWGRSAPGHNYFGIKSHGQGGGQDLATQEYVDGRMVTTRDSFRRYNSPGESVAGYADFILANPRYRPLMSAQGLDAQLEALGRSGYATDPNYARSVGSIARGINLPAQAETGRSIDGVSGLVNEILARVKG